MSGQQFFNDALSRHGECRGAITRARTRASVSLRVNRARGLFKTHTPSACSPFVRPSFIHVAPDWWEGEGGTGCRPTRRFDTIPLSNVFDRTKVTRVNPRTVNCVIRSTHDRRVAHGKRERERTARLLNYRVA